MVIALLGGLVGHMYITCKLASMVICLTLKGYAPGQLGEAI